MVSLRDTLKMIIGRSSFINSAIRIALKPLRSSLNPREYWNQRYKSGGTSGTGSYGRLAEFKAEIINSFVKQYQIKRIIDFGCGDGNQLTLFDFPTYVGLDISRTAIDLCLARFKNDGTKRFFLYVPEDFEVNNPIDKADLVLSLDVIYHLVEDRIFQLYMLHLFSSSNRFVIIYSDDIETDRSYHEKHRQFTKWVKANLSNWELIDRIRNRYPDESCADFFIYKLKQ